MQRSIALGHCICNPKQACPCTIFKAKNLCPCAGERPEQLVEEVRLTSLVEKAGCASKINQSDLKKILADLPAVTDPNVIVGTNTCDDAGVYKIDDEHAVVQTVDVFTPCVDDPYTFGRIAAANSLSDVYAMGGRPITALSIIGFPIETISHKVMTLMLRGGMDAMSEAEVAVVGGHSINDPNPKFGYAVTGLIHPSHIVTNSEAKAGDVLILTKPLGVGIVSFAAQLGRATASSLEAASKSMAELNKTAAEAMTEIGVHAATDVTGFGLLGHLSEMAAQSGVSISLNADLIPVFDEVIGYIDQGMISGGIERNREFASKHVSIAVGVSDQIVEVLYDPQTSGGLLISVAKEKADDLLAILHGRGVVHARAIGEVTAASPGSIKVVNSTSNFDATSSTNPGGDSLEDSACCCSSPTTQSSTISSDREKKRKFTEFMKEVNSDGAIPARTKELMAIALSILSKCEPCVNIHLDKARSMGITEEEISESVWMAVSFGGAPIKMFYESVVAKSQ